MVDIIQACRYLEAKGYFTNEVYEERMYFEQLALDQSQYDLSPLENHNTGRAVYVSNSSPPFFLYHTTGSHSSPRGRWMISKGKIRETPNVAYSYSWAPLPYLVSSYHDSHYEIIWKRPYAPAGDDVFQLQIHCHDESLELTDVDEETFQQNKHLDKTLFIEANSENPRIDGYYIERYLSNEAYSVYSHIKIKTNDRQLYLFNFESDKTRWLIGGEHGVDSAYAYIINENEDKDSILYYSGTWNVLDTASLSWKEDNTIRLISLPKYEADHNLELTSIVQALRRIRSVDSYHNYDLPSYHLRNGVLLPMIGLGTGGIYHEQSHEVFTNAIDLGYRLFDLAREYGNEGIMGEVVADAISKGTVKGRDDFFLETKVWPTELGFDPTTNAILHSLRDLRTSYVDLYLIHWPECNKEIDWMHCETTADPSATWRESWYALEKAYEEGRVMAIGFSNADIPHLKELEEISSILPAVIQNWSELGSFDMKVREWCYSHHTIYQPYASIRNLRFQNAELRARTHELAAKKGVSEHAITLKFYLQTSASIIPRASQYHHLKENIQDIVTWDLTDEEMAFLGWEAKGELTFSFVPEEAMTTLSEHHAFSTVIESSSEL